MIFFGLHSCTAMHIFVYIYVPKSCVLLLEVLSTENGVAWESEYTSYEGLSAVCSFEVILSTNETEYI